MEYFFEPNLGNVPAINLAELLSGDRWKSRRTMTGLDALNLKGGKRFLESIQRGEENDHIAIQNGQITGETQDLINFQLTRLITERICIEKEIGFGEVTQISEKVISTLLSERRFRPPSAEQARIVRDFFSLLSKA